jgi:hypothetical protein
MTTEEKLKLGYNRWKIGDKFTFPGIPDKVFEVDGFDLGVTKGRAAWLRSGTMLYDADKAEEYTQYTNTKK